MEELNKNLESLTELLNEEIKKVVKKADITPVELENMTKTICLIEKIKKIEEGGDEYEDWEEGQSGRNSYRSYGACGGQSGRRSGRQNGYYDGMSGVQGGRQSGYYNPMEPYYGMSGEQGGKQSGRQSGGYYDPMDPYYGMSGRRMRSSRTGRYMSGSSYGTSDQGYSGHSIKDRMVAKLEEMYDEAKTDHEKQIVDEWIERLTEER